jgi:hypothetical protein
MSDPNKIIRDAVKKAQTTLAHHVEPDDHKAKPQDYNETINELLATLDNTEVVQAVRDADKHGNEARNEDVAWATDASRGKVIHFPRDGQMADDKKSRGEPDRSRINTSEDYEMQYWTELFGVSRQQLLEAVNKVGNSAAAVRAELGK